MRYCIFFIIVPLFAIFCIANVFAQSPETEDWKAKVEKELSGIEDSLKQQAEKDIQKDKDIASLKEEVQKKEEQVVSQEAQGPGEEAYLPKKSAEFEKTGLAPDFGGIDTKPFLRKFGRNTYLGGYMDFLFRATDKGNHDGNGFEQQRFIPFIYSDISDRVKLAAEIEFERGGVQDENVGEAKIEFATIDFLITDWINWRGGLILSPLGKLNLVHDSPLQEFAERPLVDQLIIPTTLTDTGMGFFGSLYPSELSKLTYEIYVTNGVFHGLDADGTPHFSASDGLMDSKGGFEFDNPGIKHGNLNPGVVGRVEFSPFIGLEFGGSAYTSRYDEKNNNQLTIPAFDFAYQKGPFVLAGEGAYAFIGTDSFAKSNGITDDMWGYYVEARYKFMPPILRSLAPKIFTENSTFAGVLRWDQVQTAGLDGGNTVHFLRDRITPGLNYRYTQDTVFKLDYEINMEGKDMPSVPSNALVFSVATYF